MIIFGAPRENEDHRFNAIACAVVILRLLERLNKRRVQEGRDIVQVRIGINTGVMMAGIVGSGERMEYTVVGDPVNLASRIIELAEPGSIVVGEAVLQQTNLKERINSQSLCDVKVKGKSNSVSTYLITGISPKYQSMMDGMIEDILSGGENR